MCILIRLCGACCGLSIFSAIILGGMLAGLPPETILLRALGGLFGGMALGLIGGQLAWWVIREGEVGGTPPDARSPAEAVFAAGDAAITGHDGRPPAGR